MPRPMPETPDAPVRRAADCHDLDRVGHDGAALLQSLMDGSATRPETRPETVWIPPRGITVRRSTQVEATDDPILQKAFAILRQGRSRAMGPSQVADALGISRTELDHLAHRELGHSLAAEIVRQRLAQAKVLLAETDLPLRAVAMETGFCHAAHLANAFRDAFGVTPGKFRAAKAAPQFT